MMGLRRGEVIEMSWDELRRDIKDCNGCMLFHTRMHAVIGRGSSQPLVVFIGEAPGRDEDKKGIPFVGLSGQILDAEIRRIGLSYNEYYICNAVKCRPTTPSDDNRKPTNDEINRCAPFLAKQLILLRPDVIVTLGVVAKDALIACKMDDFPNKLEFIHPAYTLRKRKMYLVLAKQFDRLKDIVGEIRVKRQVRSVF